MRGLLALMPPKEVLSSKCGLFRPLTFPIFPAPAVVFGIILSASPIVSALAPQVATTRVVTPLYGNSTSELVATRGWLSQHGGKPPRTNTEHSIASNIERYRKYTSGMFLWE
jgi:hypothetical protein